MKTSKAAVAACAFVVALATVGLVCAEEFRSPVLFKSDVNFDNGSIIKVQGTTLTATASQLNTLTGAGTMTASNLTMTGSFVTTPQSSVNVTNGQSVTLGGFIYVAKAINGTNGALATIALANPSASGQWAILYNQQNSTNRLVVASSGNFHGPAVDLAGGESALLFAPTATNWAGIGQ